MPIKRENAAKYPADWRAISAAVRRRAKNRCEGSPGHYPACRVRNGEKHPVTGSVVVLTVAHLDRRPENNDPMNLRAMCQRCHLAYDRADNLAKARISRRCKRAAGDFFEATEDR